MISVWSFLVVATAIALVVWVRSDLERKLKEGGSFQCYGNKKRSS